MAVGPRSVASDKASVTDNGYVYQVRSFASHSEPRMKKPAVSHHLWKQFFHIIILDSKYNSFMKMQSIINVYAYCVAAHVPTSELLLSNRKVSKRRERGVALSVCFQMSCSDACLCLCEGCLLAPRILNILKLSSH